jgi:two-component system, OmpR family, phosphate regulon response regulator PhoB
LPTVLIAENDNPGQQDLMVSQLEQRGFSVCLCADGEQVLATAGDDVVAVVLKEHPAMGATGLHTCRQLRARQDTASVPILMVSDVDSEDEAVDAFDAGTDDWLSEPVHPREFVAHVNGLLRRVSRHRDSYHRAG